MHAAKNGYSLVERSIITFKIDLVIQTRHETNSQATKRSSHVQTAGSIRSGTRVLPCKRRPKGIAYRRQGDKGFLRKMRQLRRTANLHIRKRAPVTRHGNKGE